MAAGDFTVDSVCEEEYTGGFHPLLVSFRSIAAAHIHLVTYRGGHCICLLCAFGILSHFVRDFVDSGG